MDWNGQRFLLLLSASCLLCLPYTGAEESLRGRPAPHVASESLFLLLTLLTQLQNRGPGTFFFFFLEVDFMIRREKNPKIDSIQQKPWVVRGMNSKEYFNHVTSLQMSWNKSFKVTCSQIQKLLAVGISPATPYGELLALTFWVHAVFFLAIIIGKIKLHFYILMAVLAMKSRILCMLGKCSPIEQYSQSLCL